MGAWLRDVCVFMFRSRGKRDGSNRSRDSGAEDETVFEKLESGYMEIYVVESAIRGWL